MTAEQHTSIAHSDGDTPRVDEIDPDLEAYKRAYVMAINYSTGNFGEKFREVEQRLNRRLAERPNRAVARGDSVTISREAISVMLLAAKWAEGKIGVRENPLILAIMNLEAAVQNALTTPTAADTEQIDDQVQDVLTVLITHGVHDYYGIPDVSQQMIDEIIAKFRKDLASLGIRLTYDTTIGGE